MYKKIYFLRYIDSLSIDSLSVDSLSVDSLSVNSLSVERPQNQNVITKQRLIKMVMLDSTQLVGKTFLL